MESRNYKRMYLIFSISILLILSLIVMKEKLLSVYNQYCLLSETKISHAENSKLCFDSVNIHSPAYEINGIGEASINYFVYDEDIGKKYDNCFIFINSSYVDKHIYHGRISTYKNKTVKITVRMLDFFKISDSTGYNFVRNDIFKNSIIIVKDSNDVNTSYLTIHPNYSSR